MTNETIENIIKIGSQRLSVLSNINATSEALILFGIASNMPREDIIKNYYEKTEITVINNYEALIEKRLNHEPIAYIRGDQEFWSMKFIVNHSTLIPRADSETLVEIVIKNHQESKVKIIDCGTGSGCLLISILSELKLAHGLGIDLSVDAIQAAQQNAINNQVNERAIFEVKNWNDMKNSDQKFDVLISNPPYITSEDMLLLDPEVLHEPRLALFGGNDGLEYYREILSLIPFIVKQGGLCYFEIGYNQEEDICTLITSSGMEVVSKEKDLSNITRVIVFRNF